MKLTLKGDKIEHSNIEVKTILQFQEELEKFAKEKQTKEVDFVLEGKATFTYSIGSKRYC